MNLGGVVDTQHGCVTFQVVSLNKLEKTANRNLKKLRKGNCEALHLKDENLHASVQAGSWLLKAAFQKDVSFGRHHTEHEAEMHPCSNEGQQHPGLH